MRKAFVMAVMAVGAWIGEGWSQNSIPNGVAAVVNSEAITLRDVLAQTQMEEDDLKTSRPTGRLPMMRERKGSGLGATPC